MWLFYELGTFSIEIPWRLFFSCSLRCYCAIFWHSDNFFAINLIAIFQIFVQISICYEIFSRVGLQNEEWEMEKWRIIEGNVWKFGGTGFSQHWPHFANAIPSNHIYRHLRNFLTQIPSHTRLIKYPAWERHENGKKYGGKFDKKLKKVLKK